MEVKENWKSVSLLCSQCPPLASPQLLSGVYETKGVDLQGTEEVFASCLELEGSLAANLSYLLLI